MNCQLEVLHDGDAWVLRCPSEFEPIYFSSGWPAEAAGRFLALSLAVVGHPAKLVVRDRRGAVAGRLEYPSSTSWRDEEAASWREFTVIDAGSPMRAPTRQPEELAL